MTIRCFRWDDAGAPQLGAASSLSVILEKCLVDGYGTQGALGWGKIKSSSGKVIAFQPPVRADSRPWLLFDDRCAPDQDNINMTGAAGVRLYEGLSAVSDSAVVNDGAKVVTSAWNGASFIKYRGRSGAILKWLIIADSEQNWFHLLTESYFPNGKDIFVWRVFGALSPVNSGDAFGFVFSRDPPDLRAAADGAETSRGGELFSDSLSFTGANLFSTLQFYADHGAISLDIPAQFMVPPIGVVNPGIDGVLKFPNAVSNKLVLISLDPVLMTTRSAISGSLRGRLGGVYAPLNASADKLGAINLMELTEPIKGMEGRKLLALNVFSPYLTGWQTVNENPAQSRSILVFDLTGAW